MTRRGVRACRGRGDTEVPAKALALDVEAELRHVTVGHHVVLALDAHPPRGAGSGHRPGGDQVVVRDDLSLDEAALEVRVDDARGLRCGEPLADRPRARLLRPGGQERLKPRVSKPTRASSARPDSSWPYSDNSSPASAASRPISSDSSLALTKTAGAGLTSSASLVRRPSSPSAVSSRLNT